MRPRGPKFKVDDKVVVEHPVARAETYRGEVGGVEARIVSRKMWLVRFPSGIKRAFHSRELRRVE